MIDVKETVRERRPKPIRRGVARRARRGHDSDHRGVGGQVIRYLPPQRRRALPSSGVATVAIRRRHGRTDVAKGAGRRDVRPGQRETRRGVVKHRAQPGRRRVARRAGGWISRSDVIRHRSAQRRGALPLRDVAAIAIRRQRPAVISSHMAQRAGHRRVRPGQRERGRVVIERRRGPIGRRVAERTILRKRGRNMIRHCAADRRRAIPVGQMAANAGRRTQREVVAHVARRARRRRRRNMHSRQRKPGRAVIERRRVETHRRVAIGAVRYRKCGCGGGVRWIRGPLPAASIVCVQVAAGVSAGRRRDIQSVVAADVAQRARHARVAVGQRETRCGVIEYARGPRRDRVARGTLRPRRRKSRRHVIRHRTADRRGALKRRGMAPVTIRRIQRVVVAHVARRARRRRRRHVRSDQRKPGHAVIERRRRPACRRMARRTVRRPKRRPRRRVHRIIRLLPGGQMALRVPAGARRDRQRIVPADVAQRAGHVRVSIGQRETRCGVIEHSRGPRRDRMAGRARRRRRRESRRHVIRHRTADRRRAQKRRLVAPVTIRCIQRVVVAHVARRARRRRRRHVCSRQRKSRHAVIERRRRPPRRRMARRAVRRRKRGSRRRVHRSIRLLPGRQMALRVPAGARRDRQIVVVVDVAQRAGHIRMPGGQRKPRRAVIERGRRPTDRIVAGRAIRRRKRRPRRWMHRIRRRLPGRQMASRISAIVRRDRQIVIVVDVAQRAGHIRVPVRQQKSRRAVVELGVRPIVKRMARRAVRRRKRRSRRRMHRIRRRLPIRQVARHAGRR